MTRPLLLLVDDSAEMGLIVVSLGKRAGFEVSVCVDAETAWEALSRRRPDLVLLDVNLPAVSGPEWLRRVRAAPEFTDLPVALYTHWGLTADVAAGMEAGADFVFDKDLAARPAEWQKRLLEIRALAPEAQCQQVDIADWSGANASAIIGDGSDGRSLMGERIRGFNYAIRYTLIRFAPPGLIRVILRRALVYTFTLQLLPPDWESWIALDGCGLEQGRLPASPRSDWLLVLSARLLEQMGRLVGAEATSALRDALTAGVPGLLQYLAGS
jgi:CheY-like chemotaxis protein